TLRARHIAGKDHQHDERWTNLGGGSMGDNLITAVFIDDHEVALEGFKSWCATATPPIEVLECSKWVGAAWAGPGASADVVVLDLGFADGRLAYPELRRLTESGRRVVVYTQHTSTEKIMRCIGYGALAYVTKAEGP